MTKPASSAFDLDSKVENLTDIPEEAPKISDTIRPKPKLSARLSVRILGVFAVLMAFVFWIYMSSLEEMDARKNKPAAEQEVDEDMPKDKHELAKTAPDELVGVTDELTGKRIMTLVKPEKPKPVETATKEKTMFPDDPPQVPSIREAGRAESAGGIPPTLRKDDKNHTQSSEEMAAQAERESQRKAYEDRMNRMQQARQSGMKMVAFDNESKAAANADYNDNETGAPVRSRASSSAQAQQANSMAALQEVQNRVSAALPGMGGGTQGGDQEQKSSFIKNSAKETADYHPYRTIQPLSKNEVKVGTYIPMILNQGINSDLPGQITARVAENVYDTVTGCRLLIPAMTNVIGRYDSKVSAGQTRNLIVWNHMIFPDGGELNLGAMQGYDTNGFAGMEADVDNHFWKLFGLALGMSTVTATLQASVPQQNNTGNTVQNPGQMLQNSIAQQYGQLGSQIIGKYLAVQPTLKNYAGERFMITVPHTVIMDKVWRHRCEG